MNKKEEVGFLFLLALMGILGICAVIESIKFANKDIERDAHKDREITTLQHALDSLTNNPYYPLHYVGLLEITAFCSYKNETDESPFLTKYNYSLTEKDKNITCASNLFPFGTEIFIESIGWVKVVDGISKKYNNRIDIYFWMDKTGAKTFGKQVRAVLVR